MKTIFRNAVIAVVVAAVLISITSTLAPLMVRYASLEWTALVASACILISWILLKAYRHAQTTKELKEIQTLSAHMAHPVRSPTITCEAPLKERLHEPSMAFRSAMAHMPTKPTFFKVKVQHAAGIGEPFTLEVTNNETVGTLRRRIAEITVTPLENVELMLEGRKVNDEPTMKDLNLKGNEVFVVSSSLRESTRSPLHIYRCPFCGSSNISRSVSGELFCERCGAVINVGSEK
jgi:hypothetical protein